ncbi:MAG: ABC-F family ATP-binding cassette domain-containing protein, partial [Planctomycetota bacterium]
MPVLIQFSEALKSYGKQPILDDASVQFSTSDKMGLIGCNGSGKSTLCKLILGEEELDGGRLKRSSALRLGYLKQEDSFGPDETVLQFLERDSGCESWQCGKTAGRFDLKNEILEAKVVDLPGGYQTRVKLAAMLLGEPNFLVLDEPTNYLDLKTLILLELFLADFNGGFLIVSHDREFLKRTCESTLEIERGELTLFPGGIEPFLAFKAERQVEKQRRNRNVDARRKQMEDFIARNKVRASTASRAQSKMKQLDKLQKIEVEHRIRTARIKIPEIDVRRGLALRCEGLAIGYGESEVASSIRFEIQRGEKVAVLGDNGEGKTTFLRTIAGELARLEGEYSWGHGLEVAYYAQHVYSALNPGLDIYTHLDQAAAPGVERQEILRVAGSFLFSGEEVEKKISILSGGERARVCLAGLLLGRRPVLLLDEPTNHLDFETVEALAQALAEYAGTVFFVSHDRTFVSLVASNIVDVGKGRVVLYPDTYESYVYRMEQDAAGREEAQQARKKKQGPASQPGKGGAGYQQRKQLRSSLGRLESRCRKIDGQMKKFGGELKEIHREYEENPLEYSPLKQGREKELQIELAELELQWLELQAEIE